MPFLPLAAASRHLLCCFSLRQLIAARTQAKDGPPRGMQLGEVEAMFARLNPTPACGPEALFRWCDLDRDGELNARESCLLSYMLSSSDRTQVLPSALTPHQVCVWFVCAWGVGGERRGEVKDVAKGEWRGERPGTAGMMLPTVISAKAVITYPRVQESTVLLLAINAFCHTSALAHVASAVSSKGSCAAL